MILAEKAEALREEADSLSTVPTDTNSHWMNIIILFIFSLFVIYQSVISTYATVLVFNGRGTSESGKVIARLEGYLGCSLCHHGKSF